MTHQPNPTPVKEPIESSYFRRLVVSLKVPAYRWLWISTAFGTARLITVFVARGWLVLLLTDSPFWVGAVVAARGVTQIALGTFSGVLLDRVNRRQALIIAEFGTSLAALTIGLLVWFEQIELWHMIGISVLEGIFVSVRWPAINTLIYQIVGPKRLLNASASQMLGFNIGNIGGSTIAGLLIAAYGIEMGYFFAAGCGFIGIFLLFFVQGSFAPQAVTEPFKQALQGGLRYIWHHQALLKLLTLSFIVSFLGWSHISMMPVMARDVLGVDAAGLGFLTSAGAIGGLITTSILAGLGDYRRKALLLLGTAATTAILIILFALSTWYPLSLGLEGLLLGGLMAFEAILLTMVQLLTSNNMQGRVQGIATLVFGFTWLGGLAMGSIATLSSAPVAIALGGAGILVALLFLGQPILQIRFSQ